MDRLVMSVGADELVGLQALAKLAGLSDGSAEELERVAGLVLRQGLAARLREVGLLWAPAPALVDERLRALGPGAALDAAAAAGQPEAAPDAGPERSASAGAVAQAPRMRARLGSVWGNTRVRVAMSAALAIATLVALVGGYAAKWSWTGFASNDQVWDWLKLLLLPVAFGTLPLWLQFAEHMSRARKASLLVAVVAFTGFVVAGYLVPISWTGFSGNNLWDWLTLIVLPVALITVRAWPSSQREIRQVHVVAFGVLGLVWFVTLIGGYDATWQWTGYPGNTLWDWLQLLLAPLVITTILVPATVRWVSGDAARLAEAAERDRAAAAARAQAAAAQAAAPAAQPAVQPDADGGS